MSTVTGLTARLTSALLSPAAPPALLTGQSVRRRWFGRCSRVLPSQTQLTFQIRDLLFGVGYLLFRIAKSLLFLDQFLTQPLDVPIQPFVLTLELPPLRRQRFRWW